jgi:MFS family permease
MKKQIKNKIKHTFRALNHRYFRLFWVGQWISVTGTWMQTMALSWLVYRLTNSPMALGLLAVARFGPSLIGSPFAGVIADKFQRRRIVITTQSLSMIQAVVLATLTLTGIIEIWQIFLIACFQGCVDTVDMTARQTLQMDIVGPNDLQSAISLNSAAFNAGRIVGPGLAGIIVAIWGEGICFLLNSVSYIAVLISLIIIKVTVAVKKPDSSIRNEILEGMKYVWSAIDIRRLIFSIAITSTVGQAALMTLTPIFAKDILKAGPAGYGTLLAGAGVGAIFGALITASRNGNQGTFLINALGQGTLGIGIIAVALTPHIEISALWMVIIGMSVAVQLSSTNAYLQTNSPAHLRGRVISIYIWIFSGLSPLGSLVAGAIAEHAGAVATAIICGSVCLLGSVFYGIIPIMKSRERSA